jgi:hypothetical protein
VLLQKKNVQDYLESKLGVVGTNRSRVMTNKRLEHEYKIIQNSIRTGLNDRYSVQKNLTMSQFKIPDTKKTRTLVRAAELLSVKNAHSEKGSHMGSVKFDEMCMT